MFDPMLLLRAERRLRLDRDGRVRDWLVDALARRDRGPETRACCPPPCCFCCWEAL